MADDETTKDPLGEYLDGLSRADVQNLANLVAGLKEAIETSVAQAVRNQSRRWQAVGIVLSVVCGLLIAAVVGLGAVMWRQNEDRKDLAALVEAQESDLDQRRIDACERDNTSRAGLRLLATTTAGGFTQFAAILIGDTEIDEDLRRDIEEFQNTVVDPILALSSEDQGVFAERDCSREALVIG